MQNRTSREIDRKLAEARGETWRQKLVLELDEDLAALWMEVKNLAAHRTGGRETEALRLLAREWLGRNRPARKVRTERRAVPLSTRDAFPKEAGISSLEESPVKESPATETAAAKNDTRYVPAALKREIWRRDEGKCARCDSRHALEIDHVQPFALGGATEKENLRLLCRSCNGFEAIRAFGTRRG